MTYYADRVKGTSTTTGTGAITISSTPTGFVSFGAAYSIGDILPYTIDDGTGNWEVGVGALTATAPSPIFTRDIVYASSNAGALVNFPAGTKTCFVTLPSEETTNTAIQTAAIAGMIIP